LLREELRIKDARMGRIATLERPHYPAAERMAILTLQAARAWNLQQTAERFHVAAATVSSWHGRLEERGPEALVQSREPANRLPDCVGHVVRQLQRMFPSMGKVRLTNVLARAGLQLAATTVGRLRRKKVAAPPPPEPPPAPAETPATKPERVVRAKRPNHVWSVDLTVLPTGAGMRVAGLPSALLHSWLFCRWVVSSWITTRVGSSASPCFARNPARERSARCWFGP